MNTLSYPSTRIVTQINYSPSLFDKFSRNRRSFMVSQTRWMVESKFRNTAENG